jgi:hypothetical protein
MEARYVIQIIVSYLKLGKPQYFRNIVKKKYGRQNRINRRLKII